MSCARCGVRYSTCLIDTPFAFRRCGWFSKVMVDARIQASHICTSQVWAHGLAISTTTQSKWLSVLVRTLILLAEWNGQMGGRGMQAGTSR